MTSANYCGKGCPVGEFYEQAKSPDTEVSCVGCPAGRWSHRDHMLSGNDCTPCAAGKFSKDVGALSSNVCVDCATGKYSDDSMEGAAACTSCPVGRSSTGVGRSSLCEVCVGNMYQDEAGQTSCKSCPLGKYISIKLDTATDHSSIDCCITKKNPSGGTTAGPRPGPSTPSGSGSGGQPGQRVPSGSNPEDLMGEAVTAIFLSALIACVLLLAGWWMRGRWRRKEGRGGGRGMTVPWSDDVENIRLELSSEEEVEEEGEEDVVEEEEEVEGDEGGMQLTSVMSHGEQEEEVDEPYHD